MALGYYPNQKVSFNGYNLTLVQNVNIDFNLKKNVVNEFGNQNAVGYVSFEGPTLNTTIEYYANVGEGLNLGAFGLSSISTVINEIQGKGCVFSHDGGSLTTTQNYITNYSIKGQVGSIPTVAVSAIGLSGSYVVGGGSAIGGSPTDTNVITPQIINVNGYTAKSFNCSLNIQRQIFYELGTAIPLGVVATEPPKITVDLEIILGGTTDIDSLEGIQISSAGGNLFRVNGLKVTKYSTKGSINGVAVSNVSLEGLFKNDNCTIYY